MDDLGAAGAGHGLPRGDRDYAIHVGLRMLTLRRLAAVSEDGSTPRPRRSVRC